MEQKLIKGFVAFSAIIICQQRMCCLNMFGQALLNLLAVSSNGISYIVAENGENVKGNANKNVCPAKSFRVPADP